MAQTQEQALAHIQARVRDFAYWLPPKEQATYPEPAKEASLEEQVAYLRQTLPLIGARDRAWHPGGYKRNDLDEAFSTLQLSPLEWSSSEDQK